MAARPVGWGDDTETREKKAEGQTESQRRHGGRNGSGQVGKTRGLEWGLKETGMNREQGGMSCVSTEGEKRAEAKVKPGAHLDLTGH